MYKTFEILEKIESVSGRNDKIARLTELKDNWFAVFYFNTTFNPFLTYGVSVIPDYKEKICKIKNENDLLALRNELVERKLTGNAAREILAETVNTIDPIYNKWIRKMWERDLKIGISVQSIDKIFPKLIPKFEVALCNTFKEEDILPDGNWIVERKFDGNRILFTIGNGRRLVQTRNGKEVYNVDHILDELEAITLPYDPELIFVFDGEIYSKDWSETASVTRSSVTRIESDRVQNVCFYVFDILPYGNFVSQSAHQTLAERKEWLRELFSTSILNYVKIVPFECVKTSEEAWNCAKKYKEQGFEGAVLKNLNSTYEFDRGKNWLKLKFMLDYDLEIVDALEGTGRNAGRLGALVCQSADGVEVNVGSGYSDKQRIEFWSKRYEMIGKIISMKCQEVSKNSLRFPRFIKSRPDLSEPQNVLGKEKK